MTEPARRIVLSFLFVIAALAAPMATRVEPAVAAPSDSAKYAAIVVDANTGEVLYARRADSPRYPASITKVMTLYLAFEALSTGKLKPTDVVVMSPRAAAQPPSKLGLHPGETLTVDDAIRALAIKSANDVAVAMAEKIGGTESRFAALMTLKAQELGMTQTRFVNAHGLPDSRQLSSARDIAILARAVMRDYPQYYSYFSQKTWTFRGREMRNHNGLLHRMPGVDGLKTGFTNASGYNLAASAVRDGRRLITVVLGGASTRSRDDHVADLLNVGFDVMRRRERGEIITVAQSMFEPQMPTAPVQYAALEQGDRSAAPAERSAAPAAAAATPTRPRDLTGELNAGALRASAPASGAMRPVADPPEQREVVLASVVPTERPAAATPARPKPAAARPKRDPNAVWAVQVGAFKSRGEANSWLKQVGRRFADHFRRADGSVQAANGWYRTRYAGLTQEAAKKACAALKAKRLPCMVLKNG